MHCAIAQVVVDAWQQHLNTQKCWALSRWLMRTQQWFECDLHTSANGDLILRVQAVCVCIINETDQTDHHHSWILISMCTRAAYRELFRRVLCMWYACNSMLYVLIMDYNCVSVAEMSYAHQHRLPDVVVVVVNVVVQSRMSSIGENVLENVRWFCSVERDFQATGAWAHCYNSFGGLNQATLLRIYYYIRQQHKQIWENIKHMHQ